MEKQARKQVDAAVVQFIKQANAEIAHLQAEKKAGLAKVEEAIAALESADVVTPVMKQATMSKLATLEGALEFVVDVARQLEQERGQVGIPVQKSASVSTSSTFRKSAGNNYLCEQLGL